MSTLPNGWAMTSIGQITDYVQRGKSPKYADFSELPVINQKCIRWFGIQEENLKYVDPAQWAAWSDERFLRNGDILWNSTGTGTIGRAALYRGLETAPKAVADSHVTIVRANNAVIPDFLHRFIQSPAVQSKIDDMQAGSTNQVELGKEAILTTSVPLPPLPEQKRIVAKIDSLSGRSKRARDHLDHIPRLVEKYKQAVLAAAFRGRLTQHENEFREKVALGSLIAFGPQNGIYLPKDKYCKGIPILRIQNYGLDRVDDISSWSQVAVSQETATQFGLSPGDLVINRVNSPSHLGKTMVVTTEMDGALFESNMMRLSLNPDVAPEFLQLYLSSSEGRANLTKHAKWAVNQASINQRDVAATLVPRPTYAVQLETVKRITSTFSWIERLASEAANARKLINNLDQSVLTKAFWGELVPQDPSDEPAGNLLDRIAAERAVAPKAKRGRSRKE